MASTQADSPLRVLIVMPLGTQRGGAELQLLQLIEYRREAGLAPTVAFLAPGPMVDRCREHGVPAVVIPTGRLRQTLNVARTARGLANLATSVQAEIIIGWMAKGQVYGGLAACLAGLPSVWLQPADPSGLAPIDRVANALPSRGVVTVSKLTDRAQNRLIPRRPTTIVHPAVDTSRFDAARIGDRESVRRRLGLPDQAPIFGAVGRLNSWKGFHHLLAAVPLVLEHHPNAVLVLVGGAHELEPEYARVLADQATRLGLDGQVRLVGQQANPEEWMQAMDVVVHTSQNEPFGMVVIEAMALGKPVVATAEGGPLEVITPEIDGLLCPHGDHQALAAAIVRLLGDPQLSQRLGCAAERRARDFTVQKFARQFGAVVVEAARPAAPPSPVGGAPGEA